MPRTEDSGNVVAPSGTIIPPPAPPPPPAPASPPPAPAPPPPPPPPAAPSADPSQGGWDPAIARAIAHQAETVPGSVSPGTIASLIDSGYLPPDFTPPAGPPPPAGPNVPPGAYGSSTDAGPFAGAGLVVGGTAAAWEAAIANARARGGGLDWVAFPPGVPPDVIDRARAAGLRIIAWQPPETADSVDPAELVAAYGAAGYLGQAEGPGQWQQAVANVGAAGVPAGIITNNWAPGGYGGFPPGVVAMPELYVNEGAQADFGALANFTAEGARAVIPLAGIYSDANAAPTTYAGLSGLGLPGVAGYSGEDPPTTRGLAAVTGASGGGGGGGAAGPAPAATPAAKQSCFEWGGERWGKDFPGATAFRAWLRAHNVDVDTWAFNHALAAQCIGIAVPGTPGVGPDTNAPAPPPAPGTTPSAPPPPPPPPPPSGSGPGPGTTPAAGVLRGAAFVSYVRQACDLFDIDPLASFANAINEGLGGGIGDSGLAYGPWQDHLTEFAGRPFYGEGRNNAGVQAWAWSAEGIQYVHRQMSAGRPSAAHLRGPAAVEAIVRGYERPADIPGAISTRSRTYSFLVGKGAGVWGYLAAAAGGPSLPGQVPGTPGGPAPTAPPAPAAAPAGVQAAWAGLIDFYALTVPQRHQAVKSLADGLVHIFQ